jgi:hypothetical protein
MTSLENDGTARVTGACGQPQRIGRSEPGAMRYDRTIAPARRAIQ